MRGDVSQMKWWGWGDENIEFDASDKPFLMPFIARELGLSEDEQQKLFVSTSIISEILRFVNPFPIISEMILRAGALRDAAR